MLNLSNEYPRRLLYLKAFRFPPNRILWRRHFARDCEVGTWQCPFEFILRAHPWGRSNEPFLRVSSLERGLLQNPEKSWSYPLRLYALLLYEHISYANGDSHYTAKAPVYLKFSQIHIQGAIESKRGSDRWHDLTNQAIQIGVRWSLDIEVPTAKVVNSLVINHEGAVRMLQGGVGGKDGIVRFHYSRRDLRRGVDSKLQLGFLAVVNWKAFHEQWSETWPCTTPKGMEDQESLEASALVSLQTTRKN